MFDHLSAWHLLVLAVVGVVLFGPDKLPGAVRDAVRALRAVRTALHEATRDIRNELGPEITSLTELHPRRLLGTLVEADPPPRGALRQEALPIGERPPFDLEAT